VSLAYSEEDNRGLDKSSPLRVITSFEKPGLALYFTIAIAAIDGLAIARFKRNLGGFAAVRACGGEHLTGGIAVAVAAAIAVAAIPAAVAGPAFCFPGIAARVAAFGLIGVTLGLEKFLVLNTESERGSAIGTLK
jgi:hypothetical protein